LPALAGPLEDGQAAFDAGDFGSALRLWQPLADAGNADAEFQLGRMYLTGRGVEMDGDAAVSWLARAVAQGKLGAAWLIAQMYDAGFGVTEDPTEAVYWYAKAADADNPAAWYQLADHYDRGIGVEPNGAVALGWYRKLADAGDVVSQNRLGELYRDGRDDGISEVAQDEANAAFWFGKAAAIGYGDSQLSLGRQYAAGIGVAQDNIHAYMWLTLAGDGFPQPDAVRLAAAMRERDAIAARMTPADIATAENLVAAWRPAP
jgi:hypothetical protein